MSVKEIVEKTKKDYEEARIKQQEQEELIKKLKLKKKVEEEVESIISSFEDKMFNINSTEEEVADIIVEDKGRYLDTINSINEDIFDAAINTSRYSNWVKTLKEKFDVRIYIYRHETHSPRYSNSGYMVGTDDHYQGVKAEVALKKE
jgi:hypothetical protein